MLSHPYIIELRVIMITHLLRQPTLDIIQLYIEHFGALHIVPVHTRMSFKTGQNAKSLELRQLLLCVAIRGILKK